ncbi:GNAT family N-acetyltransferase [Mesorhizobium japonicum]|uniref:acyl-homoserine-lactone synthase n=1 Tax=Mesorhizobium TaxID=68287 RepID=UPI00080027DB|nr:MULTISPECIES: acyl-homoserine-lactone synthase [Mesorhizobium]MUT22889.1 GNAT family N-acetyltransferase [Mesorhizobium japonicum]OBQ96943.1 conjugal transfer protein TraI [Mesorhizobium sp. AA23]
MMQLITPELYGEFPNELKEMHGLRHRVFKERLDWEVETESEMETDAFDSLNPVYLLLKGSDWRVCGCVRLLPTTGPTMLRDSFPMLLGESAAPASAGIWESSRFALDLPPSAPKAGGLAQATYELFAGMVEFGLANNLTRIVTVTDTRMERILRLATWPLSRIGQPKPVGNTEAVAGFLEISHASLLRIRWKGRLNGPVLWQPVLGLSA